MVLLLQLNGDLPEFFPGHERRLYVFTCRRKTCRRKEGSVRAIRGVRVSEAAKKDKKKEAPKPVEPAKPPVQIGESLFGAKPTSAAANANPFSTGAANPFSTGSNASNPFSTSGENPFAAPGAPQLSELAAKPPQQPATDLPKSFASALNLNNNTPKPQVAGPVEPWPADSDFPASYTAYYLADADYETLDKDEPTIPQATAMDIDDNAGSSGGKEEKEVYESTIDKTFQKFADRLAQNPEQVIRYEFRGQPLLYSKSDKVGKMLAGSAGKVKTGGMPRCANCGADRVFEVQLTPHAITELESEEEGLEGMEWGTILLGVCNKDCSSNREGVNYLEEWAGVQWEEVAKQ